MKRIKTKLNIKWNAKTFTAFSSACMICGLAIASVCIPAKEFSENENRYLEKMPQISWKGIKDKTYMEQLETYSSDHFVFRDAFMSMGAAYQKCIGKTEINGVYLSDDGYLIEKYETPQNTESIINKWNTFEEKIGKKVDYMLIPTAVSICEDKLPAYAKENSQSVTQKEVFDIYCDALDGNVISVWEELRQATKEKQLFYKTDHHWTTYGAYVAYEKYCKTKGLDAIAWDELNPQVVSNQFWGTIFSKVNDVTVPKEEIIRILPDDWDLTVAYQNNLVTNSLYAPDYLEKKDKYSYFLNNLNDKITITNNNLNNDKTLVVIKDSYANCFVPFLVNHYENIIVFDTRYYLTGVSKYILENDVTDVLIMYNLNTLDTDTGIRGIY